MTASIFVWTLDSVVTVALLGIGLLLFVIGLIQHAFNVTFKKNCLKCKHSVPGGVIGTYKCDIKEKNRTIRFDEDSKYVFCKEYKEE